MKVKALEEFQAGTPSEKFKKLRGQFDALKEKGYHPTGISVQIYSFTQKELLIMMSGINGNVEEISEDVRLIVNQVAETNQLGSFGVTILGND